MAKAFIKEPSSTRINNILFLVTDIVNEFQSLNSRSYGNGDQLPHWRHLTSKELISFVRRKILFKTKYNFKNRKKREKRNENIFKERFYRKLQYKKG